MTKHYTSQHLADLTGIDVTTIRRLAKNHNIGTLLNPRMRVYTHGDIALLRDKYQGGPGRPRKDGKKKGSNEYTK